MDKNELQKLLTASNKTGIIKLVNSKGKEFYVPTSQYIETIYGDVIIIVEKNVKVPMTVVEFILLIERLPDNATIRFECLYSNCKVGEVTKVKGVSLHGITRG